MGLVEEPLVTGNALAAVYTNKHVAVASEQSVSGYSLKDGILEYNIPTPAPVTALAWSPGLQMLVAISRGRCYLQDPTNRKKFDFGTTSAVAVAAAGNYVVVASKRRLRFVQGPQVSPRELSLAVSALAIAPTGKTLCALRSNSVAIVDLAAQKVLPVAIQLPSPASHVACFDNFGLIIAGQRGYFMTLAGRIVSVVDWDSPPAAAAYIADGVFGVLVNGHIEIRNPATGSLLVSKSFDARTLGSSLAIGANVTSLSFQIAVEDVLDLDPAEAVSLVGQLPDIASDSRVKSLRTRYAMSLLDDGHFDRALALFSETDTPIREVASRLQPLIDNIESDELVTDMSSVFSNRTSTRTPSRTNPALDATIRYLVQTRRRLAITAASTETEIDVDDAKAVDTLLFTCYIKAHSPLVGPLVRVDNFCDVDTVRATLLRLGKWKELTAFLSGKERHEEALELLRDKASDDQIVDYLLRFASTNFDLIQKFSRGPIARDPTLGLQLFETTLLNKVKIHNFLLEVDAKLAWELVDNWIEAGDETRELHTRKAQHLVDTKSDQTESFLRSSKCYDAKRLLKVVETPSLQAALYGRLNEHDRVLNLYISEHKYESCEQYCEEKFQESPDEGTKATQIYFDKLLTANAEEELISLLNSQGDRLDFNTVLAKMPPQTPSDSIVQYLTNATTKLLHNVSKSHLSAATAKVFLAEMAYDVVKSAQVKATVTPTTTCTVCHKRVGKSAIGLTARGGVVHYGCL